MDKRLLAKEEFLKLHEDFFGEGSCDCSEIDDTDLCYKVAKAQDAKTLKAVGEKIEALTDDGWWLKDIIKALKQGRMPE